ncbi:MAG: RNA-binding S4 domain-containing protein [Colwellia sp.]
MSQHLVIELNQQPIELYKLLKIANLVSGGGEAKMVISEGYVFLNGEVEFQKRKKIYHQDIIEFNGDILELEVSELEVSELEVSELEVSEQPIEHVDNTLNLKSGETNNASPSQTFQQDHNSQATTPSTTQNKPRKRNPISF